MVRIGAAIAVIVLAVLFGLTVVNTFGPGDMVVPTSGVTAGGPQDSLPADENAQAALSDRTRLQEFRALSGPSPEGRSTGPATGQEVGSGDARASSEALVSRWLNSRDQDWQVLRDRESVVGTSPTLPDPRAGVLIQQGRVWRRLHNEEVTYGGGWIIFGVSLLLALFLLIRGRIPLKAGFSGKTVKRFGSFERFNHWFTATSFVILALTGLVLLYGQYLIRPWLGAGAYGDLALASLYGHVAFTVAFTLGLLAMIVMWTGRNIPKGIDWQWLKRGGGFLSESRGDHPPAEKFNAGQKLIFWAVTIGGVLMIASGVFLMFPFFWAGIGGMQFMLIAHAVIGLVLIGVIIGHIYIGTVGMEGAIDAMWSGEVDRNWAEEHHDLWVKHELDRQPRERAEPSRPHGAAATPAE